MRKGLGSLIMAGIVFGFASTASALTGAALQYDVKIKKMEMYNSTTSQWVTVYDGLSPSLDIAEGASGNTVGSFLSGLTVSDGVYTKGRITPAPSFTIKGSPGGYHTTGTTTVVGGRTVCEASDLIAAPLPCTATVLDSDVEPDPAGGTFPGSGITVTDGAPSSTVEVLFGVDQALVYVVTGPNAAIVYPDVPDVEVRIGNI
jgi:hypothetical protein